MRIGLHAARGRASLEESVRFTMRDPVRRRLQAQLQESLKELQDLEARLRDKADYGPGKGDPGIYEWEYTLARRQQVKANVESIRQMLQKVEDGSYGRCEHCGNPINPERLLIFPLATLCVACAQSQRT